MYNNFYNNFKRITKYYEYLIQVTKQHYYVGTINEWVIDNYYLVVENKNFIENKKNYIEVMKKYKNVYLTIKKIIEKNNYKIDTKLLINEINKLQKENKFYFKFKEISAIPKVLSIIYIEKLEYLCRLENKKLNEILEVEKYIDSLNNGKHDLSFIKNNNIKNYPVMISELNYQLQELGSISNIAFKEFNEYLKSNKLNLKKILNDEYQKNIESNILMTNIFKALKLILTIENEYLYKKISKTEKTLETDYYYKKMTKETKNEYRRAIIKYVDKHKKDELEYVNQIIEESNRDNKHIGFYIFKCKNLNLKFNIYIITIITLSILFSLLLCNIFIDFKILGFLILLIPISELVIQITNKIMMFFNEPKPIFKLDYSKGIPKEDSTMVVIPTILSNSKKVSEMFQVLETYYLANKDRNLYFTLLGDAKEGQSIDNEEDEKIIIEGIKNVKLLNKKYNRKIFFFAYRRRMYNTSEESYLGYERKRGALLHFNKLLLNKLSNEEKNEFFKVQTLDELKAKIKYVITLDSDTKLVLNTAQSLVGAMSHPMNLPVLNEDKSKVTLGYGIMQPRITVDIESTNKSLYSCIFAGMGGFDSYNAIIPDFYQDVFKEGSFIGKGIYNLEVFDTVLDKKFEDNIILSHDLIEGNYLRCAYVSDIELIDDFPSAFLTDTTRIHRWARGDTQIIPFIKSKVRNYNHELINDFMTNLEKWKIIDNIRRMFLSPSLLLIILLSYIFPIINPLFWLVFIIIVISTPLIFYLKEKMNNQKKLGRNLKYYQNILIGGKAILLRSYILFITIPYYTYLYLDAFIRSLYRMMISKKKLLSWLTAEDAKNSIKNNISNYINSFWFNYLISILMIILTLINNPDNIFSATIICLSFTTAPFVLYYLSKDKDVNKKVLSRKELKNLKELAFRTWNFFDLLLKEEFNYLIPDNYQINRTIREDRKTSPTNIGFSLLSIISAYKFRFIDKERTIFLIHNIIDTIIKLDKWNGHLYNWYDIETLETMKPEFTSTVDSGNFISSLIVVKEFLKSFDDYEYISIIENMINDADFSKLYSKENVFSLGYNQNEGSLSSYNYNKFASESRLTSYLAIAKGDIPPKHWFSLDKSLTSFNNHKGLASWSGTAFEYFMPLIFVKSYPNTILDESYFFSYYCQKSYMNEINPNMPWGISEAACNELDNSINYKYKTFSIPYLKVQESLKNRIVISPYSSILAIQKFPEEVYDNIVKLKKLNMYGDLGFYESYDYDYKTQVLAYFSHHQGMILTSLANYLLNGLIQDYFDNDIRIKTFDILNKEKVQIKPSIDIKMNKYKNYNYKKEILENDIRSFNYISELKEISVLSNSKYTLLMNDRGNSFSRYKMIQLNRYRKITEQEYGIFLYIKDVNNNYIWCNTYAPINKKSENYEVVFSIDKIKYNKLDNEIMTTTEIIVTKNHNAEIRKISFNNLSNNIKELELTTYTEPIIEENINDINHRTYENLFISSEIDKNTNSLIMKRKIGNKKNYYYMVNRLIIDEPLMDYQYETDRKNFIGRGNTLKNPIALNHKTLSNKTGTNIDPVMSIRNRIKIEPFKTKTVYLINGFGKSIEQINEIINNYENKSKIDLAFNESVIMNNIITKNLHINGQQMRLYNIMLNYLYHTSKINVNEERQILLKNNNLSKEILWKYGISGDYPIVLMNIHDIKYLGFVKEVIKAFEYFKNKGIYIDLIIINNEEKEYKEQIDKLVEDEKYRIYSLNDFNNTFGNIFCISKNDINSEERILLNTVARIRFNTKIDTSLEDSIYKLQHQNKIEKDDMVLDQKNIKLKIDSNKIDFYNEYGGFINNGKEYIITNNNTPVPWSNVLSNKNFGSIVSNNGQAFTYYRNSREFKLTSWSCDMVVNDLKEFFKINNELVVPQFTVHGFGYTTYFSKTKKFEEKITEFVSEKEAIKFYIIKIKNTTKNKQEFNFTYFLNPVLGDFEEKTARYIYQEFNKNKNYVILKNVCNKYFNEYAYIGSTEIINDVDISKVTTREICNYISLDKDEEIEFAIYLGASSDISNIEKSIKKYKDIDKVKTELNKTKDYWNNQLNKIQIQTNDKSLDYMLNGWYLYQTISSRLNAKAGFYQVGGATGYRDQLQDAINICIVDQKRCREQILENAKHQFMEGDVLHWWHEEVMFGLRSRYQDDFLWLVYAVIEYLKITEDKSILKEEVPYVFAEDLKENEKEKGINYSYTSKTSTLLEHCLLSLKKTMYSLGKHNIPLMGGGDWNDGMNNVGIKGKGESVWLGFFAHMIISDFINIIDKYKLDVDTKEFKIFLGNLKNNLINNTWDKTHYLRAFFDNGEKLGSNKNDECKIDLLSQSFSILSKVATKEQISKIIKSVEKNLVDKNNKLIKLLDPPFSNSKNNPGYIMKYEEGIRENGGQYTHSVAWYIIALLLLNENEKAYEYYQMINPINRTKTKKEVEKYTLEPYVIAADIYTNKNYRGKGGWSFYTGSSGWFYKVGIEYILGIKRRGNILYIEPKLPKNMNEYFINYKYIDTNYQIKVIIGQNNEEEIIIDDRKIFTTYIELKNDKINHNITVVRRRKNSNDKF